MFLVSLKAGGVALNLTEVSRGFVPLCGVANRSHLDQASRVYLMDSWWNPAVEFRKTDCLAKEAQNFDAFV